MNTMKETISIKLPDGSKIAVPTGSTPQDIANSIGPRLGNDVVVAKVNNTLVDLNTKLAKDCSLLLFTGDSEEGHDVLLHSTAHLMAQAVKLLYPDVKITIGPTIENGFYYDFDLDKGFSDEDLKIIESKMRELANSSQEIIREELTPFQAKNIFEDLNESYKVEIINEIDPDDQISIYKQSDFIDLCRGPHVSNTKKIKYFKLLSSSGAYWRGDESNKMLQRIYGTVFSSKEKLKKHLENLEKAKKRDHRKLGKELELFTFDSEVGAGLPLWLPKGTIIINELESLAKSEEKKRGYQEIKTPHLTKGTLYEKSGHLDHYKDSMYPPMIIDDLEYYLKPMNCPHHHKVYASKMRSYRDLPIRLSEYGTCYRYEKSGQLFGLMRVRSLQMNDAHIYCTEEQFKQEFLDVCKMYLYYFEIFDIKKYKMRLSLHDKKGLGKKYVNQPDLWKLTEKWVREVLIENSIQFYEIEGEAAFYGPKIDVQVWSAIGKEFTLATNQVDFSVPKKFNLTYKTKDGILKTPLCIHRAPLGTHERFIGFLIEHFGGNFPLWLAPIQVAVLPVSDKAIRYAQKVNEELINSGIRSEVDNRDEKIGSKIRNAEILKINIMIIVGEKEKLEKNITVRKRFLGDTGKTDLNSFIEKTKNEINNRRLPHSKKTKAKS